MIPLATALLWSTLSNTAARGPASWCPDAQAKLERGDLAGLALCKASWERGWDAAWKLRTARQEEIDHYRVGIVLVWERPEGDLLRVRTDAFELGGQFYWAHESLRRGPNEVARGGVYIGDDGVLRYRTLVRLSGDRPPPEDRAPADILSDEIVEYELHASCAGREPSVYRSADTFLVEHRTLRLIRVPKDARLVSGPPCKAVDAARKKR